MRPAGDALQWLALFTAAPMPGFGVASVFGALLGAFAAALAMGRFRLTTFSDTGDTLRNLLGAALMGIGGVMALGCTVGQAITGVSTLALGSFLTFGAIVAGGFYGLKLLERWIMLRNRPRSFPPHSGCTSASDESGGSPCAFQNSTGVACSFSLRGPCWPPALPGVAAAATPLAITPGQTEGPFYPGDASPQTWMPIWFACRGRRRTRWGRSRTFAGASSTRRARACAARWSKSGNATPAASITIRNNRGCSGATRRFRDMAGAEVTADAGYSFRTIRPVAYPGRTPHIHFKVSAPGVGRLTTQMYLAGETQNATDGVLSRIRDRRARESVIVKLEQASDLEPGALRGIFDIVLDL